MTHEEILKKAITVALLRGMTVSSGLEDDVFTSKFNTEKFINGQYRVFDTIFSQKFAKAFFGSEPTNYGSDLRCHCGEHIPHVGRKPAWQYHLQQMVISDDPITYLSEFL